jgi:purine-nucleoside phosphorylase
MNEPSEIPILWDTTGAPSAFDPADWFAYCEEVNGRPMPALPPLAIQSVIPPHLDLACTQFASEVDDFTLAGHPFTVFDYRGHQVVLGYSAKGSYAAGGLDELIAMGARHVIFLGGSATLVHEIAVDDYFIPTKALRDEGVSFHYEPPSRYSYPSEALVECLVESARSRHVTFHKGPVWTTTAHFRQALPRLQAFRAEGCRAVNNEASSAFSVGRHRGADVACLLSVGDTLADDRFVVPRGHGQLYQEKDASPQLDVALDALVLFAERAAIGGKA